MATSYVLERFINRFGLTQVYTPLGDERKFVDVVFIHGFNGHPKDTWTSGKSKVFWPVQLLPPVIQENNTRILIYGYDADVTSLIDGGSKDKIHHHAEQLVAELCANRRKHKASERPIIFVAHSLGGLVVKRALIYSSEIRGNYTEHLRSIYVSTYGILFLGTPHNSETVEWGFLLESAFSGVDTEPQLINALKTNSETLQITDRQFIQLVSRYRIYFFHEAKPTNLRGGLKYIVSEESASPNIQNVERASIQQDHSHMCQFEDDSAPGFQVVTEGIDRYASKASEIIFSRWEQERREQQGKRKAVVEEILPGTFRHSDNNALSNSTLSGSSKARKPLFLVPFSQDKSFINRAEVFDGIDKHMKQDRRLALSGTGGIGKSQIAIEYCYRFRKDYPQAHIFWVHASTKQRFSQAYRDIARSLVLPGYNDPKIDTPRMVLEWFHEADNEEWLLVLDNADDINIFFPTEAPDASGSECPLPLRNYLPRSQRGSMLITTRDERIGKRLAGRNALITVEPMSHQEAQELLGLWEIESSDSVQYLHHSRNLLEALGYIPLAITQAAAFVSENHISLSKYVQIFRSKSVQGLLIEDLEDPRRDLQSENSIFKTWKMSFDLIIKQTPRAAEILSLMAVLDRQGIPRSLLQDPSDQDFEFTKAMGTLLAFSLIKAGSDEGMYEMHQLVQLATQRWLQMQHQIKTWQEKALSVVADNLHDEVLSLNWITCGFLLPQAQTVIRYGEELRICTEKYADLLCDVAIFDEIYGRHEMNVKRRLAACEVRKKVCGIHHPLTLTTLSGLAHAWARFGLSEEAEDLQKTVLKAQERELGVEHPDTLDSMSELAGIYEGRERWKEAEKLRWHVIETRERVLGSAHSLTLDALHDLGLNYRSQNRYREAIVLLERLVDLRTEFNGAKSPQTLKSMASLAGCYYGQGHYGKVVDMLERAVDSHPKSDIGDHQIPLSFRNILAKAYVKEGRHSKAMALMERTLEVQIMRLDKRDPKTINYVRVLRAIRDGRSEKQIGIRNEQGRDVLASAQACHS